MIVMQGTGWGDIRHRFLVAAGSTNHNNRAACFAFDEEGAIVRFTPHIREGLDEDGWDVWYPQIEPFSDEPWVARYEIRVLIMRLIQSQRTTLIHLLNISGFLKLFTSGGLQQPLPLCYLSQMLKE